MAIRCITVAYLGLSTNMRHTIPYKYKIVNKVFLILLYWPGRIRGGYASINRKNVLKITYNNCIKNVTIIVMNKDSNVVPGPKARAHLFGFMDETGLLSTPDTDKIFGLGLLLLPKTKYLHDELIKYRQRRLYHDEFKFSLVRRSNLQLYKGLVDLFFESRNARFCAIIIDKKNIKVKSPKHTKAYNAFAGEMIADAISVSSRSNSEYVTILADDVSTAIDDGYEREIKLKVKRMLRRNALFGVCRLESHALTELQLCDVILGSIAYSFKLRENLLKKPNPAKVELMKYVQAKIGVDRLSKTFSHRCKNGIIFSVKEKTQ